MIAIFNELKVLEIASVLAGPAVGTFFAELGANVLKVENRRTQGDVTRIWKSAGEEASSVSAYYMSVNTGKESRLLDFRVAKDLAELKSELESADIVIVNTIASVLEKYGLDQKTLRSNNKRLIFAELKGYSDTDKPAFDVVLQAETGYISMCGTEDGVAAKMPVALIDVIAAHHLKEAILIALWKRERTGQGAYVSASLYEAAIASLFNQASNFLNNGTLPQRMGTQHPNIAPYGDIFTTEDGQELLLAVGSDQQFNTLMKLFGLEEDEQFRTNQGRLAKRAQLNALLAPHFKTRSAADLKAQLEKNRIPHGFVKDLEQVFQTDAARKMLVQETFAGRVYTKPRTSAFHLIFDD